MTRNLEITVTVTDPKTSKTLIVTGDLNVLRDLVAGVKIILPKLDDTADVDVEAFFDHTNATINLLDPKTRTQSQDLYNAYVQWCEDTKTLPLSSTRMAGVWRRAGLTKVTIDGRKYWLGIQL